LNRVEPGSFLTLHYRLSSVGGPAVVDTFGAQPATLSLGTGELAPAMEARLIGLGAGSEESFSLAPGEAFGQRDAGLVQRVPRSLLDAQGDADGDYRVGDVVRFPAPDGQGSFAGVVQEVGDESVLFDFNHPLAGKPVTFDVKLVAVL
jgi:FKBP-type peptidyl-prolyl cis-trans isomerase SlpA